MKRNVYRYNTTGVKLFKIKVEHHVTIESLAFSLARSTCIDLLETEDELEVSVYMSKLTAHKVMGIHCSDLLSSGTSYSECTVSYDNERSKMYLELATKRVEQLFPELL